MRAHNAVLLVASMAVAGCGMHREPVVVPPGVQSVRTILLNGHRLRVHVADTRQPSAGIRPLIVYATGDRGWAGKDLAVYRHLGAWGYPVAGFDAPDYVKHLGKRSASRTIARLSSSAYRGERISRLSLRVVRRCVRA